MNEEKRPVVIGRMKSGKFRYHIEDDVFDAGGDMQAAHSNGLQASGVHFGGERGWR